VGVSFACTLKMKHFPDKQAAVQQGHHVAMATAGEEA